MAMKRETLLARTFHRVGMFGEASREVMKLLDQRDPLKLIDQATILSVAGDYVNQLRKSYTILCSIETEETAKGKMQRVEALVPFKAEIRRELVQALTVYVSAIEGQILEQVHRDVAYVMFLKMLADFRRYLEELESGHSGIVQSSYRTAYDESMARLGMDHSITLSIALNYSVFLHDVYGQPEDAKQIAQQAFERGRACQCGGVGEKIIAECVKSLEANLRAWS